ncbi:MAG TPA: hypothetical protein PKC03_09715, partial [Dokdonella sp.]|nr:hypothetical protein [Dokdonella sp.]
GPVPSLAGLDRLQAFYISDNQLDGLPPAIPDPSALVDNGSRLCPNALIAVTSPEWDAATGTTPWYQDCASDDLIFRDGFETLP